ncbi:MAG TPA: SDR family oxidoreductase [Solirubrobacteraceae bacterium]|nr:SDR family oxidoreductase [Solirubrobacteraceae bacterium]
MTPNTELPNNAVIVVGASSGLGRGIATGLGQTGRTVIAVARSAQALNELAGRFGNVRAEVADATDPTLATSLLKQYEPGAIVLVAGARPTIVPLHEQTWETFSVNWNTDVQITFHWLRETLIKPLQPGSRAIVISSGAALQGSPLTGGYAGAKATQRFITAYAQEEANRAGLKITYTSVFPAITPMTNLGRPAVQAYAARTSQSEEEYLAPFGPSLTPEIAGAAIVELTQTDPANLAPGYRLTGAGLKNLS